MHYTHVIREFILRTTAALCALVMVALVGIEFVQAALRYVWGAGLTWGSDLTTLFLFWLAWLGAVNLWLTRAHISVAILPRPGPKIRLAAMVLLEIAMLIGCLFLMPIIWQTISIYQEIDLPSLHSSASIKYWPVFVGTVLLVVAALLQLAALFRSVGGGHDH